MALLVAGRIVNIQRGHTEHFARALAVAGGDQRGVHIHKVLIGEEAVDALRGYRADAEHRREQIGARAQVRLGAQVFHRMALLLQGIIGRGHAHNRDAAGLELKGLLGFGGQLERALHLDGAAQGDLDHLAEIRHGFIQHDLQVFKEGTVVELDEGKGLAVAYGAHPAADEKLRAVGGRLAEKLANENFFHIKEPLFR